MPHDAFYLSDLLPAGSPELAGEKLSALTYAGDALLLGTVSGKLLLFRVTPRGAGGAGGGAGRAEYAVRRERAVDVAAGHRVAQLEALPDKGLVLALANGAVCVHALGDLGRLPSALESKSADSFALNTGGGRLAIATTKKKLKLYDWVDGNYGWGLSRRE